MRAIPMILLTTLLMFTTADGIAQSADCPAEHCAGAAWISGAYTVGLGTCTVTIEYRWRICAGRYQIQVASGYTIGDCAEGTDPMNTAIGIMVRTNAMGFPVPITGVGPASTSWTVYRPTCWRRDVHGAYERCNAGCCISDLEITRKEGCDSWAIQGSTTREIGTQCSPSLHGDYHQYSECVHSCDELFSISERR